MAITSMHNLVIHPISLLLCMWCTGYTLYELIKMNIVGAIIGTLLICFISKMY